MNVQEAVVAMRAAEEKNGEIMAVITEVEQFCNETEATIGEMLGTDNESVQLFCKASGELEDCRERAAKLGAQLEAAREYLAHVQ